MLLRSRGQMLFAPLVKGTIDRVYGENDAIGYELTGQGALFRGDFKLVRNLPPLGLTLRVDTLQLRQHVLVLALVVNLFHRGFGGATSALARP